MLGYSFTNAFNMIIYIITGRTRTLQNQRLQFQQFSNTSTPFSQHYQKFIYPHTAEYETQRISTLKSFRMRSIVSLLVVAAFNSSFYWFKKKPDQNFNNLLNFVYENSEVFLWVEAALIFLLYVWCMKPIKKYKLHVKQEIYPNIFNYFDNFQYSPTSDITLENIKPYGIFPFVNYGIFHDSVTGIYKNVKIQVFVSELYCVTEDENDKRRELLFRGICIVLGMNKKFSGHTIVKSRQGIADEVVQDVMQFLSLQKVNLEDPIFNDKFLVYSNDQVEARYLLNTTFMERLLKLIDLFNASLIQCSFLNNTLLITIPTRYDYFTVQSPFTPATFEDDINTVIDEMNHILAIVDGLKLYETNRL